MVHASPALLLAHSANPSGATSAKAHGAASEPDHEVGDLLAALACAWEVMTPEQRAEVHRRHFATHDRWDE